jgi:hypothetical protein
MYGSRWVPECWSGAFSGSTSYAASAPPGWKGLVDGAVVQGYGISTMTGPIPTLNVAGTGAFPIDNMNGTFLTISIGGGVATGDVVTATFTQSILNGGSPRTVAYTVTAATQANAAAGLAAVINSDAALRTAGVQATSPAIGGTPSQITIIFDSRVENGPMTLTAAATTGAGTMAVSHGSGGQRANSAVSYTFDAVLGKWLMGYTALQTQVPLEFCVAIANRCNANLWYTLPPHIDDTSVSQISQYVRDHLNANLKLYLEYGNEWWNSGAGFPQVFWADKRGRVLGLNNHQFIGLRNKQIMDLAKAAWSPRTLSQLRRTTMHAMQPDGAFSGSALDLYRLKGQGLNNATLTAAGKSVYASAVIKDYSVSPHRPIDATDVIGYADYWAGRCMPQSDGNWFLYNAMLVGGPDTLTSGDTLPKTGLIGAADDYFNNVGNGRSNALDFMDFDVRVGLAIGLRAAARNVTFSGTTVTNTTGGYPFLGVGCQVMFKLNSGTALPTPLVQFRNYWIVSVGGNGSTFSISDTQGGPPISFSDGSGTFGFTTSAAYAETMSALQYQSTGGANSFRTWEDYYATWDSPRSALGFPPLDVELYEGGFSATIPSLVNVLNSSTGVKGWSFTVAGNITSNVLTVTAIGIDPITAAPGTIFVNQTIAAAGQTCKVTGQISGTTGGPGQYTVTSIPNANSGMFASSQADTYFGAGQRFHTLLTAYKNDLRFKRACMDFFGAFKSLPHSRTPVHFIIDGGSQWGMYPTATIIGTTPYKSYDAVRDF